MKFKLHDTVRVNSNRSSMTGMSGTIVKVEDTDYLPYRVTLDDGDRVGVPFGEDELVLVQAA